MTPKVILGPAVEPISVTELKGQCRISAGDTSQDDQLAIYIAAAREDFEAMTGRTVHDTTLELTLSNWPADGGFIDLPRATPLIEVVSVIYKDSAGVETTWDAAEYVTDTDRTPGCLLPAYSKSYPSFTPYPASPIRIRYRAGIAASPLTEAAAEIKLPVLMMAAHLYENRESVLVTERVSTQFVIECGADRFIKRLAGEVQGMRPAMVEVAL